MCVCVLRTMFSLRWLYFCELCNRVNAMSFTHNSSIIVAYGLWPCMVLSTAQRHPHWSFSSGQFEAHTWAKKTSLLQLINAGQLLNTELLCAIGWDNKQQHVHSSIHLLSIEVTGFEWSYAMSSCVPHNFPVTPSPPIYLNYVQLSEAS